HIFFFQAEDGIREFHVTGLQTRALPISTRVPAYTYQAVSGTRAAAVRELDAQVAAIGRGEAIPTPEQYPVQIAGNVLPHVDSFDEEEDYYTKEELKMRNETRKILHLDGLRFAATCVRVPVAIGHAEVVHAEFEREAS